MRARASIFTGIFINAVAAFLAVAVISLSCCKIRHSDENGSVSVALSFADDEDRRMTSINEVGLWIFDGNGARVGEYAYSGAAELALQRYHLDPGGYLFVTSVNLTDPFVCADPTKTTGSEGLMFGLKSPASSPAHAFYGVTEVLVRGDKSQIINSELGRILSELAIKVSGAPPGSSLKATIRSVSVGLHPAQKDEDGHYGLADKDEIRSINLPEGRERSDSIIIPVTRLMPTARGSRHTIIDLAFTLANGKVMECSILAPAMRPSGKYILLMEYAAMRPTLIVEPYKINEWTEGWRFNGEILDPDD